VDALGLVPQNAGLIQPRKNMILVGKMVIKLTVQIEVQG
jgi:hypothetical protein